MKNNYLTNDYALNLAGLVYRGLVKPVFFLIDPEIVHESMVSLGQTLGRSSYLEQFVGYFSRNSRPSLKQTICGIDFANSIGLSAGFDYNAKLTQVLPLLDFGFETVGTVTNLPFGGNPKPRLGRLPKSKSLMVNKGFKNEGVHKIITRLEPLSFEIPIGISVGKTNIPEINTQEGSIKDIISAFTALEESGVKNKYYELNISCPNLVGNVDFYKSSHLKELLTEIKSLQIKKPIFVKMPINKSDKEILEMLEVIADFKLQGVIFGNLQKDRNDHTLFPDEVAKFKVGNFSGKPTEKRSNELVKLAYKNYGKKLVIIGCGGVFNAQDAYQKIKYGASLVEMITGMIYQGPQVISQINRDLERLLKEDGFKNISEAIGIEAG
jgi:dihydroorotate dehydrogenase subfamily 2